jgi:hypothetical protein
MARTHWHFSQILKQPLPDYLTFLSLQNVNGFTTTANQILMLKIGMKILKKKLTSSHHFVVNPCSSFLSEMALSLAKYTA